jgi:glycosyltransferase involved in cell wall biosynthesis
MRYAWDLWPQYFADKGRAYRLMVSPLLNYMRTWDVASSARVDHFVANSRFVARRIEKYYRRSATVVHPPVDTSFFTLSDAPGDYYLMVAAMVPYKGIDLAIEAFNALGRPLKIVGDGHLRRKLLAKAGPTVTFTGRLDDEALRETYAGCRAVIQPGAEDFGIVPLEAQATGRPVIALGRAGALDTVQPLNRRPSLLSATGARGQVPPPTGVFFYDYSAEALAAAVRYFEENEDVFEPEALREHALQFDREIYKRRMREVIDHSVEAARESGRFTVRSEESGGRKMRA